MLQKYSLYLSPLVVVAAIGALARREGHIPPRQTQMFLLKGQVPLCSPGSESSMALLQGGDALSLHLSAPGLLLELTTSERPGFLNSVFLPA